MNNEPSLIRPLIEGVDIDAAWLVLGLCAQGLLLVAIAGQWMATRRQRRIVLPAWVIYVGILASVALMVYASVRHDLVFVVGQMINMLIGFRLLELGAQLNRVPHRDDAPFPEIRPDAAERRRDSNA